NLHVEHEEHQGDDVEAQVELHPARADGRLAALVGDALLGIGQSRSNEPPGQQRAAGHQNAGDDENRHTLDQLDTTFCQHSTPFLLGTQRWCDIPISHPLLPESFPASRGKGSRAGWCEKGFSHQRRSTLFTRSQAPALPSFPPSWPVFARSAL